MFYSDNFIGNQKNAIYLVAHGFLGSTEDLFCSRLINHLNNEKLNYYAFDFIGHGKSEGEFPNLYQMFDQYTHIYNDLRQKYSENEIIPIGFSQGGAIVLKFLSEHLEIKKAILFAPLSIPEILINDRLSKEEIDLLKQGINLTKDFGKNRIKHLNSQWLDSYYTFLKTRDLNQIITEILVFFAGRDKIINDAQNEFLTSNIAQFEAVKIADADHVFNQDDSWIFISKHFNQTTI